MKVKAIFYGILSEWVHEKEVEFELQEDATYGHLLKEIGLRFGDKMPQMLWDRMKNDFCAPVLARDSTGRVQCGNSPLVENEQVTFLLMVGGG
ncbi:MAG: hypothetical protein KKF30_00935 [Proteobacteria bacterium]|nr:hypothetical protein [Pseudomonadota bacterium]MBU4470810.1 hypothetical protein [Pseudomonadota bacterium]MCG2751462.1 hypothetical protein [Desulfobacteraceae bacterium]